MTNKVDANKYNTIPERNKVDYFFIPRPHSIKLDKISRCV